MSNSGINPGKTRLAPAHRPSRMIEIDPEPHGRYLSPTKSVTQTLLSNIPGGSKFVEKKISMAKGIKNGTIDALTGLFRRDAFFDAAAKLIKDTPRIARTWIVYIDLDDVKVLNDTEGHHVGDAYFAGVGEALQLVEPAIKARFGGDEFVAMIRMDHLSAEQMIAQLEELFSSTIIFRPNYEEQHVIPIKASFAIVPCEVLTREGIQEAINEAEKLQGIAKGKRKDEEWLIRSQNIKDVASGKASYVALMSRDTLLGRHARELASQLGINADGESTRYIGSADPRLQELHDVLSHLSDEAKLDPGAHIQGFLGMPAANKGITLDDILENGGNKAATYLLGVLSGSPIIKPETLVIRGTERRAPGR